MFRVLVADKINQEGLAPLASSPEIEWVQEKIENVSDLDSYDALLVRSATKVTAEVIKKMSSLKIIARAGVGVDNIDLEAATKRGIIVVNAPTGNTISTAEHTFAMMMTLTRKICQANQSLKSGHWERGAFQGTELRGKTLGVIGFGRIGAEIAKRAKVFGMVVLTYDPFLTKDKAKKLGIKPVELDRLLADSQIITVHTPLTEETRGLLNMESLKKTKPGVMLINCARGGIIDENALLHYLQTGHVAGAALDVFADEPPQNLDLIQMEQVVVTPHIAASTKEAQLNVACIVAEEILNFAQGKPVQNSVNLPAISKETWQKIGPYYELTKTMGRIISQLTKRPVKSLEIIYSGEICSMETSPITRGLLAGFLQPKVDFVVNDVNAPNLAKEYGISFGETHPDTDFLYTNHVKVIVSTDQEPFTLEGTYIKTYGARIVNIDGFDVDFTPEGNVLVVEYTDRPGVIGSMGRVLGSHGINIGAMQVGRKKEGGQALMILTTDKPVSPRVAEEMAAVEKIDRIVNIEF
ncbi:MAG: phosphoglycerate dehydrogenase [Firmicutes bacterium]|nr:phosphoglycerate dehydrogenase [Bacillota bacterium]